MVSMDTEILKKAGLTESQAKGYIALIEHSDTSPAELAKYIGESRTNTYAIIDKLLKYGLITKKEDVKYGAQYNANHPAALENLAEQRRKIVERSEKELKNNMADLVDYFYLHHSTPGIEVHYGGEGIEKIRAKSLAMKNELLFVRSHHDKTYDQDKLSSFINNRVRAGIHAQSIAPAPHSTTSSQEKLDAWLLDRTLVPGDAYNAPVEIDIFGDIVAFIDFENDSMSTTITSKNIALAMRQLFLLAKQVSAKHYDQHVVDQ